MTGVAGGTGLWESWRCSHRSRMFDPLLNPLALRGLSAVARAGAFPRSRTPRRRQSGRHQTAFYERIWRETARELGGAWTRLADGIGEIEVDGVRTRVNG